MWHLNVNVLKKEKKILTNNLTLQGLVPLKLLELRLPKITLLIVIKNRI